MPDEKPTTEEVTLHSAGNIPGIPGSLGPGRYLIHWIERTATPIVDEIEKIVEDIKPKKKTTAPTAAADEIKES